MVDFATMLTGANLLISAQERSKRKEIEQQLSRQGKQNGDVPLDTGQRERIAEHQSETAERLQELVDIESVNRPTPEDKDAYASSVLELSPGQTATVTVEPSDGYNLRVKRVYFDRRNDHLYEINVGGDVTSVNHRATYSKPKLVTQSDRVVAQVTNESGATTVLDFELDAWAEQPGGV